jgi:hypothetical protein
MLTTLQNPTAEQYPPKSPDSPSTSSARNGRFNHEQDGADRPLLSEDNESHSEDVAAIAAGEDQ